MLVANSRGFGTPRLCQWLEVKTSILAAESAADIPAGRGTTHSLAASHLTQVHAIISPLGLFFCLVQPPDPDNMLGSSQDGRALPVSG